MKEIGQTSSPWLTPLIVPKVGEILKKTTTALKQHRISFDFIIFTAQNIFTNNPMLIKIHFLRGQKTKYTRNKGKNYLIFILTR